MHVLTNGQERQLTNVRLTLESGPSGLFPTILGLMRPSPPRSSATKAVASAGSSARQTQTTAAPPFRKGGRPVNRRERQPGQPGTPPLLEDSSRGFQAAAQFFPRFSDCRKPGSPIPTPRMHNSPGKRLASALCAAFSVATLTAFAVAPLTEEPPPHARVFEPIALNPQPLPTTDDYHREVTVARGESIGSLLRKLGQQDMSLIDFVRRDPNGRKLLGLAPGSTIKARLDRQNRIQFLAYSIPYNGLSKIAPQQLVLNLERGKWHASIQEHPLERRLVTRSAKVSTTLFAATDAAGIPSAVSSHIAEVFSSDIDFHHEVKKGDRLRLVYEMFVDPDSLSEGQPGRILALEYISGDRRLNALWFAHADGEGDYYSFDGQALKRRFLRSPLEYTRISSGFTLGRRHPIFRDWRAHKGIDYAAPTGTKIRTVGDGKVEFLGTQRGYGNVIIIKHDDVQRTLYAHMSRFSPTLRLGDAVKQGQVIGEVGQTGWATGPHLHFEFQVNGQQIDPNTMLPQPAPALDAAGRAQLRAQAEKVIDLMRWQEATTVASFE